MSCLCLPRLRALITGLLPMASLRVALPPAMATLAATLPALPAPGGGLDLRAALRLGLPPLPIPLALVDHISASATAVGQLALGLGINLLVPGAPARLALTLRSLHVNLHRVLPLPMSLMADLPGAMNLSLALSTIASLRASLGIDLLAPGAAIALKGALAPALSMAPLPAARVQLAARLAAYAKLAAAAKLLGGFGNLLPALELMARLDLPRLALNPGPLATLSLMLGLRSNLQAVLGLDPLAADLPLRLSAALRPLWSLPSFALPAASSVASTALAASFAADAHVLAGMGLGSIAKLQLPNLAPLSLVASLSAAGDLAAADCCTSS